jgi:hypothetical protein
MPKWGWWLLGSMILFVTVVTIVIIILIRKSDDDSSPEGAGPVGPAPTSSGPAPTSSGPAPTSSGPAPTSSGPGPTSPGPGPTSSDPDNTTPIGPGNAQCIMDSSLSNCYSINTESYDYSSIRGPNVPHDATGNDPPYTDYYGNIYYYGWNGTPDESGLDYCIAGGSKPTNNNKENWYSCNKLAFYQLAKTSEADGGITVTRPSNPSSTGKTPSLLILNQPGTSTEVLTPCGAETDKFGVYIANTTGNDTTPENLNVTLDTMVFFTKTQYYTSVYGTCSENCDWWKAQKYLVVYTDNGLFTNQYPLFLYYFDKDNFSMGDSSAFNKVNGSMAANVVINNLVLPENNQEGVKLFFYITDNMVDLRSLYSDSGDGSWTIVSDPNCISTPLSIFINRVNWSVTTAGQVISYLNYPMSCDLDGSQNTCYGEAICHTDTSAWQYKASDNGITFLQSSGQSSGGVFEFESFQVIDIGSGNLNITNNSNQLQIVNDDSTLTTLSLPIAVSDDISVVLEMSIIPTFPADAIPAAGSASGSGKNICANQDSPAEDTVQTSPVLVVYTTNGTFANQYPMYYLYEKYQTPNVDCNSTSSYDAGTWNQYAYVYVSNLILSDNTNLEFFLTDGFIEDLPAAYVKSGGSWAVTAPAQKAPYTITIENLLY